MEIREYLVTSTWLLHGFAVSHSQDTLQANNDSF